MPFIKEDKALTTNLYQFKKIRFTLINLAVLTDRQHGVARYSEILSIDEL